MESIHPTELPLQVSKDICTELLVATLGITSKSCVHSKHLSIGQ